MDTAITTSEPADYTPLITLVTNSYHGASTRRDYAALLTLFLHWHGEQGRPPFTPALVNAYLQALEAGGKSPSSINQALKAIKALVKVLQENQKLNDAVAERMLKLKGVKQLGVRTGRWLTREQMQDVLYLPDRSTLKGLRDYAILAVLGACGLRRQEVADLCVEHMQLRDGCWVIVDLVGKGNRVRSVPMASGVKAAVDRWLLYSAIIEGRVFRAMRKGVGGVTGESMTPQAILMVVRQYAPGISPHDLRRTCSRLAIQGGYDMKQLSYALGHSSVQITERYVGNIQDITDAPGNYLGLRL